MRLGFHAGSAGTLEKTAERAAELGANAMQIFSASPRMWYAPAPDKTQAALLEKARVLLGITPLVIHANYLINLCSADDEIRAKSIKAFRGEITRGMALGAEYLVFHPGSSKGSTVDAAIERGAAGLIEAAEGLESERLSILFENAAGQGSAVGAKLEEIATLKQLTGGKVGLRLGYCLDTCHLFAAGFDVRSAEGLTATLDHADAVLGLKHVSVIHTNDSKTPLGSRVDRHDNIGAGLIGLEAFRRILNAPQLQDKAFILETPTENEGDRKDLALLRRLVYQA